MIESGNRNRRGTEVTHIETSDCDWAEEAMTVGSCIKQTDGIKSGDFNRGGTIGVCDCDRKGVCD